jgi:hypothetical protein
MEYEKPDLEELELALEGSFLSSTSTGVDVDDSEETDEVD